MDDFKGKLQWAMTVSVWHGPQFGHKLLIATSNQFGTLNDVGHWNWRGIGIPTDIFSAAQGVAASVIADHLLFRYGVAEELPLRPGGDPQPF